MNPHINTDNGYSAPRRGGPRHRLVKFLTVAIVPMLTSCTDQSPVVPVAMTSASRAHHEDVSICHVSETGDVLKDVPLTALQGHLRHGDHVARLIVDPGKTNPTDQVHFARITDALDAAKATRIGRNETVTAACRITIVVSPGLYRGSVQVSVDPTVERLPLVVDVPGLTLRGALDMPLDSDGRAIGAAGVSSAALTTLAASPGLISIGTGNALAKYAEPMIIVNAHPDGSRGDGAVIEGFVFQSGNEAPGAVVGGNAVWAMRVDGLVVRGNQIEGGFAEPVEMRASNGRIEHNLLVGRGGSCSLCVFGPGDYRVSGNRQVGLSGRLAVLVFPAIFAAVPPGVEQNPLPATSLVTVAVTNNQFRDHQEVPLGIGVRVAAIGPSAPNVIGTARVTVQGNDLSNNRFGIVAEAGFPVANTALRSNIELTLGGNNLGGSCQVGLLVALTNQGTAIGTGNAPSLRNSAYTISLGGDIPWPMVWFTNPAGVGNTLTVDGQVIANGSNVAYDGTKSCPVL